MGVIENVESGRRCTLGPRCLLGRASHCTIRITRSAVSGEHATLRYHDGRWHLRDLGSRNGTRLDDQPLEPGVDVALNQGAVVTIGNRNERWTLACDAPPSLRARSDDGRLVTAAGGLLVLPDEASPECTLYHDGERWWLEGSGEVRRPGDQSVIDLPSGTWQLEVPVGEPLASTAKVVTGLKSLHGAQMRFEVSRDGEHVTVTLAGPDWEEALGARAHHDVLHTLARARFNDEARHVDLPSTEHGWLYGDELCKRLGIPPPRLDLHVFRARRQLADAGIVNAGLVIERRPLTQQLRLGVARVSFSD